MKFVNRLRSLDQMFDTLTLFQQFLKHLQLFLVQHSGLVCQQLLISSSCLFCQIRLLYLCLLCATDCLGLRFTTRQEGISCSSTQPVYQNCGLTKISLPHINYLSLTIIWFWSIFSCIIFIYSFCCQFCTSARTLEELIYSNSDDVCQNSLSCFCYRFMNSLTCFLGVLCMEICRSKFGRK